MKFKCPACKEIFIIYKKDLRREDRNKNRIKSYCSLKERDVYLIKEAKK